MTTSDPFSVNLTLTDQYQILYNEPVVQGVKAFWVEGWIDLSEMLAGDIVEIKVSVYFTQGQVYREYAHSVLSGNQTPIQAFHIGGILSRGHKIEIAQTNSSPTFRNISSEFYQVNREVPPS